MEKNLAVALLVLLVIFHSSDANSGALIKSKSGQPLTSSTLIWMSLSAFSGTTSSNQLLEDAVSSGSPGGGYVCRFQHAGRTQIGSTITPTEPDPSTDQDIQSGNPNFEKNLKKKIGGKIFKIKFINNNQNN